MSGSRKLRSAWTSLLITGALISRASADDMPKAGADIGPLLTSASARIGGHVDWGAAECGPPRYLANVCAWELGSNFSLTSTAIGQSTMIVIRWKDFELSNKAEFSVFSASCKALLAGLHPGWARNKVEAVSLDLLRRPGTDRELKRDGILHASYRFGASLTCEAQPG